MTATPEDEALEPFIRTHIHSAEELEALLLLFRTSGRWWSAEEAARALHLDPVKARRALERLCGAFLEVKLDAEVFFRFSTLNAERERMTARLDRAYHGDRSALMKMVSARGAARDFADAFRLKKEEP